MKSEKQPGGERTFESDVTRLLSDLRNGDARAFDDLIPLLYDELHRMARRHRSRERADHTLNTTGLVHEAFEKIAKLDHLAWQNRAQFFAIAAQAMRRILVTYAERRNAQKRGGGAVHVSLDESRLMSDEESEYVLELDAALLKLKEVNERMYRIIECRFYAGLTAEETAEALGISRSTIQRDWAFARAWLNEHMRGVA